jgi:LysR family cyn operon transcriptional activator
LGTVLPNPISAAYTDLHAVALLPPMPSRHVVYAWRKGAYRTAASKALVDVLTDLVRDLTSGA